MGKRIDLIELGKLERKADREEFVASFDRIVVCACHAGVIRYGFLFLLRQFTPGDVSIDGTAGGAKQLDFFQQRRLVDPGEYPVIVSVSGAEGAKPGLQDRLGSIQSSE